MKKQYNLRYFEWVTSLEYRNIRKLDSMWRAYFIKKNLIWRSLMAIGRWMETYTLPFDQKPTHYNDCFDCTTFTVKKAIFCKHNMCWSFVGRYCILIMGTGKTNKSWAEETNTHNATIFSLTKQACRKDMMVWHEIETVVSPFKNIPLFFCANLLTF